MKIKQIRILRANHYEELEEDVNKFTEKINSENVLDIFTETTIIKVGTAYVFNFIATIIYLIETMGGTMKGKIIDKIKNALKEYDCSYCIKKGYNACNGCQARRISLELSNDEAIMLVSFLTQKPVSKVYFDINSSEMPSMSKL